MFFLVLLHAIGVILAALIALIEIESIIPSGLILSVVSLVLAVVAYRRKRAVTLYYALAAPTVSCFCFALIYGLHWGPDKAKFPIGVILAIYSLINTGLGAAACRELKTPQKIERRQGPFQFSIASIMGLTLVVALSLSLIQTLGDRGLALATILCHLSLVTYLLKRYHQEDLLQEPIKTSHSESNPRTSAGGG
jgi:hypothetical protein